MSKKKEDEVLRIPFSGVMQRLFEEQTGAVHYALDLEPVVLTEEQWSRVKDSEELVVRLEMSK